MRKVYLRALEIEDYKTSVIWWNDRKITDNLGGNTFYVSATREKLNIENFIANDKTNLRLAICLKEDDSYVGNVNLSSIDYLNRNAEFSILLGDNKKWGKGIAKEATLLMLKHGFEELGLVRIYLTVLEKNERALGLYEKIGFFKEGVIRKGVYKTGEFHNFIMMSILKEEFSETL